MKGFVVQLIQEFTTKFSEANVVNITKNVR